MARPLRIQYEGAIYYIMSRGNGQMMIFLQGSDRRKFLEILKRVVERKTHQLYREFVEDGIGRRSLPQQAPRKPGMRKTKLMGTDPKTFPDFVQVVG